MVGFDQMNLFPLTLCKQSGGIQVLDSSWLMSFRDFFLPPSFTCYKYLAYRTSGSLSVLWNNVRKRDVYTQLITNSSQALGFGEHLLDGSCQLSSVVPWAQPSKIWDFVICLSHFHYCPNTLPYLPTTLLYTKFKINWQTEERISHSTSDGLIWLKLSAHWPIINSIIFTRIV